MEERRKERLMAMGQRFKQMRTANGYTQEQIALYLSVDRTLLAKFEAGERALGVAVLERACRLFGCSLAVLDGRQEYCQLAVAYRAKELTVEDMDSIGKIQKIVLNMRELKEMYREEGVENAD